MDEQQIRELECNAARAMGWANFRDSEVSRGSILKPRLTADPPPGEDCEIGFDNQPVIPRSARDAEAILSALEWLIDCAGKPELTRANGVYGVYWGGVTTWRGETLGIAICRAIVGTPEHWRNTGQTQPSRPIEAEEGV